MNLIKPAFAAISNPILNSKLTDQASQNPQAFTANIIQTLISLLMLVAVIYFFYFFIMGGYHFITSEGDSDKIKTARKQITYAFIGIFVVFSVFVILKLIGTIFGVSGLETLQFTIPSLTN